MTGIVAIGTGKLGPRDTTALAQVAAHLADTSDAHDASAISFSATGNLSSTDVQAAIAELDTEKAAVVEPIAAAHISDISDAHDASAISVLDTAGNYTAADVEAVLAELPSRLVLRSEQATAIVSGFTDTAVQAAITASGWPANPARIFLPAGIYNFTTGITINGGGALSTPALHFYGHNAVFRTTTIGCTLVTLTNSVVSLTRISFHGISFNTNASGTLGVLLNNAQLCSFTDCTFNGNFSTGMRFTGTSTYNMIDGCHFGDLARGVYLASGSPDFLHIRNCMFNEQLAGSPLNWIQQDVTSGAANGIKITGNTFYGSGATLAQVKLMHVNSALIANNTFSVSPFGAIYIGAGGTSDHNSIVGNVFDKGGNADDVYLHGANRCIISNNRFMSPDPNFSVPTNTYSNIRIRDPFGSAQGSGCVVIGNASSATATALNYMVHADATCTNLVVMGNIGRADFLAAHVSNVVANNIAA